MIVFETIYKRLNGSEAEKMFKTILLLDASASMNESSDYLPNYLLALRPQVHRFVHEYLDTTPMASLGVVVMRDSISHRLVGCTTSASDILGALESNYFLFGGSGMMSLENGLRMSLSELADLKKLRSRAGKKRDGDGNEVASSEKSGGADSSSVLDASKLRIVLISASVTLIDPSDIHLVLKGVAQLQIRIDVVSFRGAVHVFQEAASVTGGTLFCPLNYEHLNKVVHILAVDTEQRKKKKGFNSKPAELIPIGFPIYLTRVVQKNNDSSSEVIQYLACPQCHMIQTSIPSTCPLCRLLLWSFPTLCATMIRHVSIIPPSTELAADKSYSAEKPEATISNSVGYTRCQFCHRCINTSLFGKVSTNANLSSQLFRCDACEAVRCGACEEFCRNTLALCPGCLK